MNAHDRTYFAKQTSEQLKRAYLNTLDRSQRADTTEAALADEFTMQEIAAVLEERGELHPFVSRIRWTNDNTPTV